MNPLVETVSQILSAGSIVLQIAAVLGLITFTFSLSARDWFSKKIGKGSSFIALVIVSVTVLGSLFYSEIANFTPCILCWYQRVFLYPQVVILVIALWKKEQVSDYIIGLSIPGAIIAGYQY